MLVLAIAAALAPADLVIENARIWSDGMAGFAEFAAVRGRRFVYVGPQKAGFVGPKTEHVDAGGRVVLPGLIDSHVHMLGGGMNLSQLQLRDAKDKEDFIRLVKEWVANLREGKWVLGGRWSVESWTKPEQPTKKWVDPVTGDRPLYLPRMDGHSALVNSAALRLAGVTKEGPPNPEGGVIDRDPVTREPTGILRESAMGLVSRHIPAASLEEKVGALRRAMAEANRHGITAVSDIAGIADLPVYERLVSEGRLTVRFFLYPTAEDWEAAAERVRKFRGRKGWVEVKGLKAYLDGSLGSRTAYMRAPFLGNEPGREGWRGLLREGVEDGTLLRNFHAAAYADLQIIAHAIGDQANHELLNMLVRTYERMREYDLSVSPRKRRPRSEHAQHLLPQDIARFGSLGVIASMQPYHKADDGRYAESYIGPERSRSSYAFKSLLDAGAVVAFGSDWPVVSMNPFLGVEAAVTGRILPQTPTPGPSPSGARGGVWMPHQNATVAEALRCYTSRAAYACFMENEIGRIEPGYRADFVILSSSPFGPDVKWEQITPAEVWVEGRKAFGGR